MQEREAGKIFLNNKGIVRPVCEGGVTLGEEESFLKIKSIGAAGLQ